MPTISAQKLALVILFFLFLGLGTVAGIYWLIFRGNTVGFISTNPKYKWEVDKENFRQVENTYRENGLDGLILVELASGFKFIEHYATSWELDGEYVFTSEWKSKFGIPILTIYMNEEFYTAIPVESKRLLVTAVVNQRMVDYLKLREDSADSVSEIVFSNINEMPLGLRERTFLK